MGVMPAILRLAGPICDVLERNCTFHILSCEYGLVFPFHKDLDVRWHGDHRAITIGAEKGRQESQELGEEVGTSRHRSLRSSARDSTMRMKIHKIESRLWHTVKPGET